MRSLFFSLVLIWVTLFAFQELAYAQTPGTPPGMPPEQQYVVLGISAIGNRTGDQQTIITQSGIYKGERFQLPSDAVRASIQQLWAMGMFGDVDIIVDKQVPQSDGSIGLFLSIHITELPRLGRDTIKGNKEIKTADIEKSMSFREGDFIRPWELEAGRIRVK